jgi:predicted permease
MTRLLRRAWTRLIGSFSGRAGDRELLDELESHIRLAADDHIRKGIAPEEAYRLARLTFGSVDATTEHYRERRGLPWIDVVAQDLRHAWRGIRRSPGFACVAVLSIGIGIGANTAIFSLVNSVLLQPLMYRDAERVFWINEIATTPSGPGVFPVNPTHAFAWGRDSPSLEGVALFRSSRAQIAGGSEPANFSGLRVTHNLFSLLGVDPLLGRAFMEHEEYPGQDAVVMLAEATWRTHFNADPSIIGRAISVDGAPHEVVGIVPAGFRMPLFSGDYINYETFRPLVISTEERGRLTGNFNYAAVVRVKRGASIDRAQSEIDSIQTRFQQPAGMSANLGARLKPLHDHVTGPARLGLLVLSAAVGAVLLIVCVNLANLLLARVAGRAREGAIRAALGASRWRQFGHVLTESLLLSAAGGLLGIGVASWTLRALVGAANVDLPRLDEVQIDTSVLAFALVLTLAAGLLFGVLPAWRFTRQDPQAALRAGSHTVTEGRRGLRLRTMLVGIQVGLSAALLVLAGLLASSLTKLMSVDKGFDANRVLTLDLNLAGDRYSDPIKRGLFFDRLLANIGAIPGVDAAGITTQLPIVGQTWNDSIYLEGAPQGRRWPVDNRYTSPSYFRVMQIPMVHGRGFDERDRSHGVAVLSQKAAALLWPGDPNPVGRTFMGEDDKLKTLVGISAEVRAEIQEDAPPHAYYPYWQRVPGDGEIVIRTALDQAALAGPLRAVFRGEDAQLPIPALVPMAEIVSGTVAQRRFQVMLMAAFAVTALLVAALGIYGVVSYSVQRRKTEMGIRMALGARPSGLQALVLREGMTPVVAGLVAGVVTALALARAMRALLFQIQPSDPLTIGAVCALLLLVAATACLVPARRATRTNVIDVLKLS